MDMQKMSIEEKIDKLSETEKAYISGYIDHALQVKNKEKPSKKLASNKKKKPMCFHSYEKS